MSLGVPIVATNIGGLPELTTQLFEVGDSKALATILNELISNPNKRKRLGQKSFEEFNYKFKEERGIEEYSKLYSL